VSDHGIAGDGNLRITPTSSPPGLAITGEIDEPSYGDLAAALERLTAGPGEIHVDLAGVEYCDLVGLRAIVGLTGANDQDHSRRVVLHNVPPHVRTVLGILGWDCTPGLIMDGRESGPTPRSGTRQADSGAPQGPPRLHALVP
jgi:anti-anti-sigma regulatory factor